MAGKKIRIPEGMLRAGHEANMNIETGYPVKNILEAALRWLSENPQVPTRKQMYDAFSEERAPTDDHFDWAVWAATSWQRHMFDAPSFEPKEVCFTKPGDYHVHVPANGTGPTVTPAYTVACSGSDAPEPEVPQHIQDLVPAIGTPHRDSWVDTLLEAFRRGKVSQ